CHAGRLVALELLPPHPVPVADAHHAVRAGQRPDQCIPVGRPCGRHDQGRPRQRQHTAALLHLPGRLQLLGYLLCRDAVRRAAGHSRAGGADQVPLARQTDPLPMTQATNKLETLGAWLLGLLWILPLAYAVWAAFHPPAYATRFDLLAPLTLENFSRAWHAAPFPRYFLNTFMLVTMVLAAQLVLSTLAGYAF